MAISILTVPFLIGIFSIKDLSRKCQSHPEEKTSSRLTYFVKLTGPQFHGLILVTAAIATLSGINIFLVR